MRIAFLCSILLAVSSVTAANAESDAVIACPHHEEFSVAFTDWGASDRFSIDLLGGDCTKAVRVITLRDSAGYPIFTNAVRLQQLAAQPLSYRDVLQETIAFIRNSVDGTRTSSLPAFDVSMLDDENFYQGGLENRENYERARRMDRPVMCVRIGYEYWECFWFDPDARTTKYLYGFGA